MSNGLHIFITKLTVAWVRAARSLQLWYSLTPFLPDTRMMPCSHPYASTPTHAPRAASHHTNTYGDAHVVHKLTITNLSKRCHSLLCSLRRLLCQASSNAPFCFSPASTTSCLLHLKNASHPRSPCAWHSCRTPEVSKR